MSLTTITSGRSLASAMLLSASQAMPPVRAPSPMTATTWSSRSRTSFAFARPSAQPRTVEACEFSMTSCSDSACEGYPERPPFIFSFEKSWRPVSSLWT